MPGFTTTRSRSSTCDGALLPLRGRRRAAHTSVPLMPTQGLGSQAGQTDRLQESQGRRGTEVGGHLASHVARRYGLHLVKQRRSRLKETSSEEFRESGFDVPVGTVASARSPQALRAFSKEANAPHTH